MTKACSTLSFFSRHGVKVGPGPRDPEPGTPLKVKSPGPPKV